MFKKIGWSVNREQNIQSWIDILLKEGYKVNDYAQSILRELGDLEIRTTSNKNHLGVTLHFNPVNAASGEYDRMWSIVNRVDTFLINILLGTELSLSSISGFHFIWRQIAKRTVRPAGIIESFHVLKNRQIQFVERVVCSSVGFLLF